MSTRPQESLKESANQLASLITLKSKDRDRMTRLAGELGIIDPIDDKVRTGNDNVESVDRANQVGIWKPRFIDGKTYYVRDIEFKSEFEQWARIQEIPPRGLKKRIIFAGESAARGYLLDPYFTPALALENFLKITPSLLQAEVIDLARNNIDMEELKTLLSSSLLLEPDILVVFAGNNWINDFSLTHDEIEEMFQLIKDGRRFSILREMLQTKYKEKVSCFMEFLDNLAKVHNIPVVYIIPEFNLVDYRSKSLTQLLPWPMGETGYWLKLKEEAEMALDSGDMEKVESISQQMIELNESNPLGYELMGYSKLKLGAYPEAENWLRQALDTAIFRVSDVPRTISVIRKTLFQKSAHFNIPIVDLSRLFMQYNAGKPPDRRFFLDYCHLSVEGINVAMAATAQIVFSKLVGKDIPFQQLMEMKRNVDADVEARSHLFAAIHNSHRGDQSYEILYHHCLQALRLSGSTADMMKIYSDMTSRHTVWSLGKSCEELIQSGQLDQYTGFLQPHDHYLMDILLVDAMTDALKTVGIDIKDEIKQLRKEEHGLKDEKIDLLESYYHLTSYMMNPRHGGNYYRAADPVSVFFLVTEKNKDVALDFTFRVPQENSCKKILLKVNGKYTKELSIGKTWKKEKIKISKNYLNDGITPISIHWPTEIFYDKDPRIKYFSKNSIQQFRMSMYPVYGEIDHFMAKGI